MTYPDLSGGPGCPNARALFEIAQVPNMEVKVSSLVFHMATAAGAKSNEVAFAGLSDVRRRSVFGGCAAARWWS